jgi:hypothetical protein
MITAMMLALAVQAAEVAPAVPDEDPPEFRFATGCAAVAEIASKEIATVLRKPSLAREDRATAEQSAAIFVRVSEQAKLAERTAARLENLSPADQKLQSRQQRYVFKSVPYELRNAMMDSCVYRFARDLIPE